MSMTPFWRKQTWIAFFSSCLVQRFLHFDWWGWVRFSILHLTESGWERSLIPPSCTFLSTNKTKQTTIQLSSNLVCQLNKLTLINFKTDNEKKNIMRNCASILCRAILTSAKTSLKTDTADNILSDEVTIPEQVNYSYKKLNSNNKRSGKSKRRLVP